MLDNWTPETKHTIRVVYRERRMLFQQRNLIDVDYRSVCTCGWRSIETPSPQIDRCPVGDALADRAKRVKKITERVEWMPYTAPTVEPDSRD